MPWYSKAEAAQYSQTSDAWLQLLADPYNTKPNNSIQWGGSTACGLPIDRFCTINSPYEPFDEIAGRDMAFQAYNHSILWARTGDVASLNRIIEILEFWMIDPATRMLPILTTYSANGSNSIEQYVFVTAFFAAYNIIKDEPSFTSEPAIKQWITDFIASAWPYTDAANKGDWKIFCCIAGAAATGDTVFLQTIRDDFVVRLNNRFLADGRVKEDYLRTTGMSYTCFALEAINATCEIIFRNLGENLFTHPGLVLAHDYMIPYILAPSTWPWQQINTFQSVESRQYEFMYTRNAQARYLPILDTGRPYYVDTATGHVTLTNSSVAVLNAPEIINIGIALQNGTSGIEAVISWDSNVPTTGDVSYGLTTAETEIPIISPTLVTSHSVILPNLTLSSVYYFTVNVQNDLLVSSSSTQSSFVAEVDTPPEIGSYSDEFNTSTIDPQWTVVDPVGDGSVTANGVELVISVPGAGVSHDAWSGGNESVRAVHPLPNENFFMEIALESIVEQRYQSQGFLVEVDTDNFIRFDFYSDGLQTYAHIGSIVNSVGSSISSIPVTTAQAQFMRVKRTGNLWEQWYSHNGVNWTLSGSFTRAITVVNTGVFAGNVGSAPIPAHTAQFNYYRINQLPISTSIEIQAGLIQKTYTTFAATVFLDYSVEVNAVLASKQYQSFFAHIGFGPVNISAFLKRKRYRSFKAVVAYQDSLFPAIEDLNTRILHAITDSDEQQRMLIENFILLKSFVYTPSYNSLTFKGIKPLAVTDTFQILSAYTSQADSFKNSNANIQTGTMNVKQKGLYKITIFVGLNALVVEQFNIGIFINGIYTGKFIQLDSVLASVNVFDTEDFSIPFTDTNSFIDLRIKIPVGNTNVSLTKINFGLERIDNLED